MRSFLGLTLLIPLYACASAATVHHSRHHVFVRHSQGWAYAAPRSLVDYNDTQATTTRRSLVAARRCRRYPETSSWTHVASL